MRACALMNSKICVGPLQATCRRQFPRAPTRSISIARKSLPRAAASYGLGPLVPRAGSLDLVFQGVATAAGIPTMKKSEAETASLFSLMMRGAPRGGITQLIDLV